MIPGEARVFAATEIEQAKEWIAGGAANRDRPPRHAARLGPAVRRLLLLVSMKEGGWSSGLGLRG
jgi:hypothetical protein